MNVLIGIELLGVGLFAIAALHWGKDAPPGKVFVAWFLASVFTVCATSGVHLILEGLGR